MYDNNLDSWKIYDLEEATKRIPPESTYKIYDALLGLESGIITPEHSSMTWNGDAFPFPSGADQDLNSACKIPLTGISRQLIRSSELTESRNF